MPSIPYSIGTTVQIGILRPDPKRKSFGVFNLHATAILYIKEGSEVSASNGIPVYPQGSVSLNVNDDGSSVQEQWSAISDTATTPVVVFESQ